jgi:hypothetical protein
MNENTNPEVTPDELLKVLNTELVTMRKKRAKTNPNSRVVLLAGGLLLILAGCGAALLILQQMLVDLPRPGAKEASPHMVERVPPTISEN